MICVQSIHFHQSHMEKQPAWTHVVGAAACRTLQTETDFGVQSVSWSCSRSPEVNLYQWALILPEKNESAEFLIHEFMYRTLFYLLHLFELSQVKHPLLLSFLLSHQIFLLHFLTNLHTTPAAPLQHGRKVTKLCVISLRRNRQQVRKWEALQHGSTTSSSAVRWRGRHVFIV